MWIDITQKLSNEIAHWPGDEPFNFELSATKSETGSVNIGVFLQVLILEHIWMHHFILMMKV